MKNWKTTLAGLLAGLPTAAFALLEAYNDGYFNEKSGTQLLFGIALILLGKFASDGKREIKNSSVSASDGDGAGVPNKGL